jgi:ketosteroid isomerase-like protein
MTTATARTSKAGDAEELERMIHAWTQAVHARDADAAVADYADDVRNFDLAPPLQHGGRRTIRDNLQGWFATFSGPVGSELRDLKIETGGDIAFAHGFNRIHGKRTDGSETSVWIRLTLGFRTIGGAWKVTHEHTSVPFYMDGSLTAAVDLMP